jgi:inner membrane protein
VQKILFIKIVVIVSIALVLLIPLSMISGKIAERNYYLDLAKGSIADSWTRSQLIVGPVIVIPYVVERKVAVWNEKMEERTNKIVSNSYKKFILPGSVTIDAVIKSEVRYKGIYKVPIYTTLLSVSGELDTRLLQKEIETIFDTTEESDDSVIIGEAYLATTVSDPRGINSIPILNWRGEEISFKPGSELSANSSGIHAYLPDLDNNPDQLSSKKIDFSFNLELRGMESLSFVPVGEEVSLKLSSSWPHPEFIGKFLPHSRTIDETGYQAEWKITSFASNILEKVRQCESGNCSQLFNGQLGVRHIEPVDVYSQSQRSLKYGFLFIGLSFISFFIFETVRELPIHAIQYTLVGCAIAIFYLLLVSLSEHIEFALAYAIATCSCVCMLLYYLRYVLGGAKEAAVFSGLLLLLYGVLYVIISAEDYAFLMGGCLTFVTLFVVMISTRNIDWYRLGERVEDRVTTLRSETAD